MIQKIVFSLVLIVPLFFLEMAYDPFELPKRMIWVLGLLLLSIFSICNCFVKKKEFNNIGFLSFVLPIYMLIRLFVAGVTPNGLYHLVVWLLPVLFFYVCKSFSFNENEKRIFLYILLIGGFIQSLLMIAQALGFDPLFSSITRAQKYYPGRMIGTIGYQNLSAEFLGLSLACVFFIEKRMLKFILPLVALIVIALFLTINRGAILGLIIASASIIIYALRANPSLLPTINKFINKNKMRILFLSIICVIFLGVFILSIYEFRSRFFEVFDFKQSVAVQSRLYMWNVALDMIKDSPFFGSGVGAYSQQYLDRIALVLPESVTHAVLRNIVFAEESHNDFIQFIAEFGFLGALFLFCFLWTIVKSFFVNTQNNKSKKVILFVFMFMFVCSTFSFTWQSALAGPLAGIMVGIFSNDSNNDKSISNISKYKVIGTNVLLLSFSLLLFFVVLNEMNYNMLYDKQINKSSFCKRGKWLGIEGAILAINGENDKAEKILKLALKDSPNISIYSNLGNVLMKKNKYVEASRIYDKWRLSRLSYYEALRNSIIVNEKLGNWSKVADLERECILLYVNLYSDNDIYRASIRFLQAGQYKKGTDLLVELRAKKVRRKLAWPAEYANLLGALLLQQGYTIEAAEHFKEALRINPNLESAKKNLENIMQGL